jgi:hypothetical protein
MAVVFVPEEDTVEDRHPLRFVPVQTGAEHARLSIDESIDEPRQSDQDSHGFSP